MFRLFLYIVFLTIIAMYSVKVYIVVDDRLARYGAVERKLSPPLSK